MIPIKDVTQWIEQAIILYKQGMPYYKIAQQLNIGRKTVSRYLRELGFKSNEKYVRNINVNKLRKFDYSIADNIFENIDTEEKAYWLGFLYADGYIDNSKNVISLSLKESDKSHVEKFRHFCGLDEKKLHTKTKTTNNGISVNYEFSFSSKKTVEDLFKCGCFNKKTFKISFPSYDIISKELIYHFIRGYIDGDGSITHGGCGSSAITLEVLGTEKFLTTYNKVLGFENKKLYSFNHTSIKRSIISGPYAIYVLDKIYNNAHIFLQRKYDKYLELRRLALASPRTARLLAGKIGKDLANVDTEVTTA